MSLTSSPFEWLVPLSSVSFAEAEVEAASEVLRSGWLTYGPVSRKLEAEFADFLGIRNAIAVSNGTAALHLSLLALGLEEGDEVLTPSLTFVAAANAILHAGGIPKFVDVGSQERPLVTVQTLSRAVTPRTRGICVMHYGGYPCAMDEIMEFARQRDLWVIEDAAHAPGASWRGTPCGAWGDIGCFSFFGNKNLTCGEGGMVVTASDVLAQKLRALRSHGMSSLTWDRFLGHQSSYDVTASGLNYRIGDVRAAILRVQLMSLDSFNQARRERAQWYRELLATETRCVSLFEGHEGISSHHLYTVLLDEAADRSRVMEEMKKRGVQTSIHYPPIHQFSFFSKLSPSLSDLEITEAVGRRILTLPLYPDMSHEQVRRVSDGLREALDRA